MSLGDVDGDGDLDAFVANYNQANRVWLNESLVLFGDYNGNSVIDAADYTAWRDALTAGATTLLNDPTPGTVDESDFLYWRAHFGETLGTGSGAAANVPEAAVTEEALADAAVTEEVEPGEAEPTFVVESEQAAVASSAPVGANFGAPSVSSATSDTRESAADRTPSAVHAVDFVASTSDFSLHRRARQAGPAHSRISPFFATVDDDELLLLATAKAREERPADRRQFSRTEADEEPVSSDAEPLEDPLACALLDWQ